MAQDRDKWRVLANTVKEPSGSIKSREFLLAEEQLASQEGLRCTELLSYSQNLSGEAGKPQGSLSADRGLDP
jgi:hypothetical protein